MQEGNVAVQSARAAMWALTATLATRAISLVSLIVLARLLTPRDFGLLALALVYILYVETIGDLGSGSALIYWPERRDDAAQVTFVTNLLTGTGWCVMTLLAAPLIAGFFHSPDSTAIIRALAWSFPLKYLGNTHDALAQKSLSFRRRMVAELVMGTTKAGVSIGGAVAGLGAWSLVWGHLTGLAVWTISLWILVPWRPRFTMPFDLASRMLSYGRGIIVVNIIAALVHHADAAVVGRFLGAAALGVYQIAYKVPEMSIAILIWVVSRVAFPAFARIQAAGEPLALPFLTAMRYVTLLTVPAAIGLFILAEPLVLTLFGAKWIDAVPVLRILALIMAVRSFGTSSGDVLKATGRSHQLAVLGMARAIVLIPALVIATGKGLTAVAIALAAVTIVSTAANLVVASRIVQLPIRSALNAVRSPLFAGGVLAAALYLFLRLLPPESHVLQLAVLVPFGALLYAALVHLIDPPMFRQLLGTLRTPRPAEAGGVR